ncbi:MAG: hypothetical protein ACR2OL_13975, partial [Anderseniella sp.]
KCEQGQGEVNYGEIENALFIDAHGFSNNRGAVVALANWNRFYRGEGARLCWLGALRRMPQGRIVRLAGVAP